MTQNKAEYVSEASISGAEQNNKDNISEASISDAKRNNSDNISEVSIFDAKYNNSNNISEASIFDAKYNNSNNISEASIFDAHNNNMINIPVIGITGGVGSGKSVVMKVLEEDFHAALILADLVGHDLMEPGGESYKKILDHFGERILEDSTIDRKKLASIVFSDDAELEALNRISHGAIREEILRRIKAYRSKGDHPFIALEAALLIEGGYEKITDQLWYIYVKPEERIRRLMRDRGYTEEKCRQIMSQQLSEEDFLAHADVVIDNNGSIEDIRGQVQKALLHLGISSDSDSDWASNTKTGSDSDMDSNPESFSDSDLDSPPLSHGSKAADEDPITWSQIDQSKIEREENEQSKMTEPAIERVR